MARGGILGVEELGPDKYRATLANGSTPIITGDAGRKAYEDFQRSQSAVGPNALAEAPSGRKGTTVTDAPRGNLAEVPPAPSGEGAQPTGMVPGGYAQALAERPPAQPTGPTRLPYAAEGVDPATQQKFSGQAIRMPDGSVQIYRPGSAGSKGGITKLGQGILDARAEADATARPLEQQAADARQRGVELAVQQNEENLAFKEKQRQDLLLQQQNEQDEAAAAEAHTMDLQAKADKAAEDFANSRAPEQSTGQSILSAIGSAMGAFGAAIGKTPNFAGEFIQQLANNRMRKWEAETNIKGKRADNMLSRYKDALGDMKLAKAAVKATLFQQAAIEAEQSALSTKSEEIGNTWRAMSAAAQAAAVRAANEKDEAFKLSFYKDKMLNAPGVAGRAASYAPITQQGYGTAQSQTFDVEANRRADEKAAKDRAEAARGGASSEKEKVYEQTAGAVYRKAIATVEAAGGKVDKDGNIVGDIDLPIDIPLVGDSGPTAGVKSQFTELGSMYANMNNAGAEAGQPTKEALTPKLGTFSNASTKAQLQQILKGSVDALRSIDARRGATPK